MSAFLAEREDSRPPGDLERRAVDALLACVARQGLRKTTLEDVAREAGCARATLYRYFASRQAVLAAAVNREAERITAAFLFAAAATDTVDDAVVALLLTARRELGEHSALRFVADFEPERLLPHLGFAGGDRFLAAAAEALAPALARYVGVDRAPRAAEWIARVMLCLLCSPSPPVALDDADSVRAYTREFLVPAIASSRPDPSPAITRR